MTVQQEEETVRTSMWRPIKEERVVRSAKYVGSCHNCDLALMETDKNVCPKCGEERKS